MAGSKRAPRAKEIPPPLLPPAPDSPPAIALSSLSGHTTFAPAAAATGAPSCPEPARRGGKPPAVGSKGPPRAGGFPRSFSSPSHSPALTKEGSLITCHCISLTAVAVNRHIPLLEFAATHSKQRTVPHSNRHTFGCSPFTPHSPALTKEGSLITRHRICIPNRTRLRLEIAVTHSKQTVEAISNRTKSACSPDNLGWIVTLRLPKGSPRSSPPPPLHPLLHLPQCLSLPGATMRFRERRVETGGRRAASDEFGAGKRKGE